MTEISFVKLKLQIESFNGQGGKFFPYRAFFGCIEFENLMFEELKFEKTKV